MTRKNNTTPRRKDRWVRDQDWMRSMMQYSLFCTIATVSDGRAFMRPSAFYYDADDHAVYIHGAHQGRSFENTEENNKVTVCVYDIGAMRVHERAFEFLQEHAGVIAFGTASKVTDNAKKHFVMGRTFAKHAPHLTEGVDFQPANQNEIDETTVIRIDIEEWSGKLKWTDEPNRPRFRYDDVLGDNRPRLPWYFDMSDSEPQNAEWRESRRRGDD